MQNKQKIQKKQRKHMTSQENHAKKLQNLRKTNVFGYLITTKPVKTKGFGTSTLRNPVCSQVSL